MDANRLKFLGMINDAWSYQNDFIGDDTVSAIMNAYDRMSEKSKAGALSLAMVLNPENWSVCTWNHVIQRMLDNTYNEADRCLSFSQQERAAIYEYDAGMPMWAAEDLAVCVGSCVGSIYPLG